MSPFWKLCLLGFAGFSLLVADVYSQESDLKPEELPMKLKSLTPNIMVQDIDKTLNFYQNILGFEKIMTVPKEAPFGWAMLKRDDVIMMFQTETSLSEEYALFKDKAVGGSLTFFIQVENIEALYESLNDQVEIVKELSTTFYGMNEFTFEDCNGYILTFAESEEK